MVVITPSVTSGFFLPACPFWFLSRHTFAFFSVRGDYLLVTDVLSRVIMKTMAGGPLSLVRHMLCVKRAPERYPSAYAHIDVSSPFIVKTLRSQVHRMDYASFRSR